MGFHIKHICSAFHGEKPPRAFDLKPKHNPDSSLCTYFVLLRPLMVNRASARPTLCAPSAQAALAPPGGDARLLLLVEREERQAAKRRPRASGATQWGPALPRHNAAAETAEAAGPWRAAKTAEASGAPPRLEPRRSAGEGRTGGRVRSAARQAPARPAVANRPALPADLAALGDFFAELSEQSRYLRFFAPVTPGPA